MKEDREKTSVLGREWWVESDPRDRTPETTGPDGGGTPLDSKGLGGSGKPERIDSSLPPPLPTPEPTSGSRSDTLCVEVHLQDEVGTDGSTDWHRSNESVGSGVKGVDIS